MAGTGQNRKLPTADMGYRLAPKPDPGRAGVGDGSLHYWSVICFNPIPYGARYGEARMTRREFIATVAATASWPIVARAQKATPVIGFLNGASSQNPCVGKASCIMKEATMARIRLI